MGNPTAGYVGTIERSADDITYFDIDGINSVSFSRNRESLEKTYLNDTDASKKKFAGIKDGTISFDGDLMFDDTNGQNAIRTAFDAGTDDWYRLKPDGTNGWKFQAVIMDVSISGGTDGKNTVSISLEVDGVVTVV